MTQIRRDYELRDQEFHYIRDLVMTQTGIVISENKQDLIYSRLSKRIRALGLSGFGEYIRLLDKGRNKDEMVAFVNAITTNLTAFFREGHHFEYLQKQALPQIMERNRSSRKIRVWSAGCSTGEEPYSIAMVLAETLGFDTWDWRVLATDIDTDVLTTANSRIYSQDRVTGISQERLQRWFKRGSGRNGGLVQVAKELNDRISFRQLNLIEPWPIKNTFDIIFCRNVVIYFDTPTQKKIFDGYARVLANHGRLFIGHSESLHKVSDRFESIGNTIYQKRK